MNMRTNFLILAVIFPLIAYLILFQFVVLTGKNQGNGKASLKFLLGLWRTLKATSKESIKQIFSVLCVGCFDGDQKKDLRRKSCYQILG